MSVHALVDVGRAGLERLVDVLLHLDGRVGARISLVQLDGRRVRADGRPARHEVQVVGQRPRLHRLEHVVVEHEVLGVGPVVRDLRRRVVAHDVRCRAGVGALSTVVEVGTAALLGAWSPAVTKPSIGAAVDVGPAASTRRGDHRR